MAARKRVSRARKGSKAGSSAKSQLAQLQTKVRKLRTQLVAEARRRKLDQRMLAEAKRARLKVTEQMSALRTQGLKLAADLGRSLRDASARERARQAALSKVAELRESLRRKSEELRKTSVELAKLARESAARARAIVRGPHVSGEAGGASAAPPPAAESPLDADPHSAVDEPPRPSGDEESQI
jgi:chromosome segregation ATPase